MEVFRNNNLWGGYARTLLDNGKFQQPRNGRNDDNAHPPIIPVRSVDPAELPDVAQRQVYELVTKHFLACCSMDAKGQQTVLSVKMGTEEVSEARKSEATILAGFNHLNVKPFDRRPSPPLRSSLPKGSWSLSTIGWKFTNPTSAGLPARESSRIWEQERSLSPPH